MKLGVDRALVGGAWVAGDVEVSEGHVVEVGVGQGAGSGLAAAPGFVDLQVNGFGGFDFATASPDEILTASASIASTGTTAFLPTLHNSTVEHFVEALQRVHEARQRQVRESIRGARIGGAHLEGPFLSRRWAGAHDPTLLIEPDLVVLHRFLGAGPLAMVTLAPELEGAAELIGRLVGLGIVVSLGHTDADAATCHRAADLGATMLTHCWNAHRRFGPRDPGPAGVALDRLAVGLICDRVHVADETIRLGFAAAGDRVCLVTDGVAPIGTDARRWERGGVEVTIDEGAARFGDGTLAGGATTMDQAVRNAVAVGVVEAAALHAASSAPGRVLGVEHRLVAGAAADLVVLDDHLRVARTLVAGRVVHES